jgi:hypothetical protein
MAKLDLLRKLIREEVRGVFQEELAGILKEAIIANKGQHQITESVRPVAKTPPATLNRQAPRPIAPVLGANNPLNSILAETAQSMAMDDFGNFGGEVMEKDVPIVESVGGMFASARGSSNLDAIQINAVPDFSGVMARMKANGEI